MQRLKELVSFVPVLLLGIAVGSTLSNWSFLVDSGGWFALLGHFIAVAATLVFVYICGVLALALLAMPLIVLFSLREDNFLALAKPSRTRPSPRAVLATCVAAARRAVLAVADPPWKALWWCWWFLRGRAAAETAANDG
jgi:hypothetical protein